ncbi:hypothetical protein, partial [Pseudomonas syringae group genomosp. 7]|uniref:hypothetical protein n=1 Tax=Pseudomonas syringae group genomosp. 7 TaxID=251699 RepID=UPI001C802363
SENLSVQFFPNSLGSPEKSLSIHFSAWVMSEKSFLPTSTPRWHHAEGAFLGGLPCIGIIKIPIHQWLMTFEPPA